MTLPARLEPKPPVEIAAPPDSLNYQLPPSPLIQLVEVIQAAEEGE